MIVFHGSNVEIDKVDLSKCRPYKDFGCGFYTTVLEKQAWDMARRRTDLEGWGVPTVTFFEIPNDILKKEELNCRVFPEYPTEEWATFINNNRNRKNEDIASTECNTDNKYDVVIGPVADDNVGLLIRQLERGVIDIASFKKGIEFTKLTNQYTFHTERSLKYLRKVGAMSER